MKDLAKIILGGFAVSILISILLVKEPEQEKEEECVNSGLTAGITSQLVSPEYKIPIKEINSTETSGSFLEEENKQEEQSNQTGQEEVKNEQLENNETAQTPQENPSELENNIATEEIEDELQKEKDKAAEAIALTSGPFYNRLIDTVDETVVKITEEIGPKYSIKPELLQAIIFYESCNKMSVSSGSCIGYMQVSERWHTNRANKLGVSIRDGYGNILTGTDYLSELIKNHGSITTALMVYHGESDAIEKANQGRTSEYVDRIMDLCAKLEIYHKK